MTSRLHARSKGGRAKPTPRTFTAATGLTRAATADVDRRSGSVPADPPEPQEVAAAPVERTQRPEAADPAERSGAPRVKVPNLPHVTMPHVTMPHVNVPRVRLPKVKVPTVRRRREERPPRVFRLHDPASPSVIAAPRDPAGVGREVAAADAPEPVTPMPEETPEAPESAQTEAAEAEAFDAPPPPPDRARPAEAQTKPPKPTKPTKAPKAPKSPKAPARAWRGPRAGGPRRERKPVQAGVANRRPMAQSRSTPAKGASGSTSRRLALPLLGRRGKAGSPSSKKKRQRQKAPATPLERRSRIPVAVAGVFALAVLATSFPLAGLLSQHHQLSAAAAQLQQVQRDNRSLTEQQRALNSNAAIAQLARGDYQMVSPGQTLYDVLPPTSKSGTSTPGSATNGDPGNQPLVAPANAPDLSPQPGLPQPIPASAASAGASATKGGSSGSGSGGAGAASTPSTFWGRVTDTLEFWK